jgi:hypothetical protein
LQYVRFVTILQQRLATLVQRKSEHEEMIRSRLYPATDDQTQENEQMNFKHERIHAKQAPEHTSMRREEPGIGTNLGQYRVEHPWALDGNADDCSLNAEAKRNVARENLRINQEQEEIKRRNKAQLHAEEVAEVKAQLAAEEGFWNLGATSDKVFSLYIMSTGFDRSNIILSKVSLPLQSTVCK